MRKKRGYRILSLEAKDLYNAMQSENEQKRDYSVRDINGDLILKKFSNMLDMSLDVMKLNEAYYRETRKKNFYFVVDKRAYTQMVINVKFNYAFKQFNKAGQNAYVRAGYNFRDCDLQDGVFVKDGKLIAIQTNVQINNPISKEILGDNFAYVDGVYEQYGTIPLLMNKSELRQYFYEHGFVCDGINYVRYKRSSGSSRVGKCLFVNNILSTRMDKWDKCGLDLNENDKIDLAAWEAYISLPMSSIIDTMTIEPENILIIDDYKSIFEDDVVAVEVVNDKLTASPKKMTIKNDIWDGESLMDISLFGKYANRGMLLLRNRFFKTCAFNTNIQDWFEDNGITSIEQLNGFTVAEDIKQIKLITTKNSIKYAKFGTIPQWLENLDRQFGVVKHEKETPYFNGRMVQSHYQLFNTLPLSFEDMESILKPSLDYITAVRNDPDVLRHHIKFGFKDEYEDEISALKSKNEIVFKMLGINNDFAKTKLYYEFRNGLIKGYMRNLKQGHVLLNGNYSTLLGNGLEMLKHAIGQFEGYSEIQSGCIHTHRFEYGATVLGSRSPHITMGNVLLAKNVKNEFIDTYFNMTNEIVYVNAINENIQQRLNGCDYDSDSILLTDNECLVESAKKYYDIFKVPTCFVESKMTERRYNSEHKADLDIKTSVNKIGEIVNLSQQLNSLFWNKVNSNVPVEKCMELYYDICKLAVLSGIEIDKAKKEFIINSTNEISILKSKYKLEDDGKTIKPMFFKMITLENGFKLNNLVKYKYFKTAMDYLQKLVASYNFRQSRAYKQVFIPFLDIIKKPEMAIRQGYYCSQRDKIVSLVREAKDDISKMYINYDNKKKSERELIWQAAIERKQACVEVIEKITENPYTMYITLKQIDQKEFRDVSRFMFEVLFSKPNETFFKMILDSKEDLYQLIECQGGDVRLYDYDYIKVILN